ncbi:MAG: cysteine synthase A [Syntrophomonadaceae bacterium]|jgi:cysteine synthase A|nr:cysteine synthase A [Bacillota bacterium]NLP23232.1 cysteine synthase A [Syntrophomonadaceae bacterium]
MKAAANVLELIGRTPIVKLNKMGDSRDADVYVKLESFNPAGSIKDRPALFMIETAEKQGKLNQESIILEATSGNTGIGLAMVAAIKGYRLVIVMPENMSEERKKLLAAYGAELVFTPAKLGMKGAVAKAQQMAAEDERYFLVRQFENPANVESHYQTTAQEILEQCEGHLDALVCGVGSGGTLTGVASLLKKSIPQVQIIAVEPYTSAVLSGNPAGPHNLQGIGAGFIPPVLNIELVDRIYPVKDEAAFQTCLLLARKEALLVGLSSGAVIYAALQIASELGAGRQVLAIAADGMDKYMSTELFSIEEV